MINRILIILCAFVLSSCKKDGEKPVGIADPSYQIINDSEDMTPIALSTSNNLEGTTFVWSRDKLDEISGPIKEGNGRTINSVGYVMNLTDVDQVVTYTIIPTSALGRIGESFTATLNVTKTYVFTGIVIDQVTRQPVSGANVYYAYRPFNEFDQYVKKIGEPVLSGVDGKYKIYVSKAIYDDRIRYPGQVIYASGNNYIGSNIGSGKEILLYHPAELNLHIIHDTIKNKIGNITIWIVGNGNFWGYPGFIGRVVQGTFPSVVGTCSGSRNIDTIYVINKLWGNLDYSVGGGASYSYSKPLFSKGFTLKPDSIKHIDVSF
jgi:hypothetical protein